MKALLIVDVQNDYFPGGRSELAGSQDALRLIKDTLVRFRSARLPVIFVRHVNTRAGATFFLPGTPGADIHADITPQDGEDIVVKHLPNSFYKTGLYDLIRSGGIDSLVVCGMMTHMCIDTTVRAAKDYELPVTLLYDACATKDLTIMNTVIPARTAHDAYMAGLDGTFASVILTAELKV